MTDKKIDKYKADKSDHIISKEMARARYEKLQDDKSKQSDEQLEDPVEAKIKEAMAKGEFDDLKGKGKPLDLRKYRAVPEHLRIAYHVLKNAGYVPEEVRLKKEMEFIKEKIKSCESKKEKNKLVKELADISQQFNFYMEINKQFK